MVQFLGSTSKEWRRIGWVLWIVLVSSPIAILHGVYDALCRHDNGFALMVGVVSIALAAWFLFKVAESGTDKRWFASLGKN